MTTESESVQRFFIKEQLHLINSVLNRIIPRHGEMPGAGELGVARHIDTVVGSSPELARLFGEGIARFSFISQQKHSLGFEELADDQKDDILSQVESEVPHFFDLLVHHAYNGYYTHPRVIELLGIDGRPPQPRGYQLEVGDLSGLERVKARGRAYREASSGS